MNLRDTTLICSSAIVAGLLTVFLPRLLPPQQALPSERSRWEYKTVRVHQGFGPHLIPEDMLRELGGEGWELVMATGNQRHMMNVTSTNPGVETFTPAVFYFKRQK